MLKSLAFIFTLGCINFILADHLHSLHHHHLSHKKASVTDPHNHGITAWIEGKVKDQTEGPNKIFFKPDSSSEIVLRDLKDLAVHCEAEFPLEILFDGYGDTRISATGVETSTDSFQNDTHQIDIIKHSTFALIFRRTGKYTCRGMDDENKNKSISAFIYVPSQQLFVSSKTPMVSLTESEKLFIPCPVSEPNATLSLVKLQDDTFIPVTPKFQYNPRKGFAHSGKKNDNLAGIYYCIASFHKYHKAVEIEVVNGPVECKRKCGPNSRCEEHNEHQICQCKTGYEETLVSEKCLKQCDTDSDCPKSMTCIPQEKTSFLPDILNIHDGRMGFGTLESFFHEEKHNGRDKQGECKNPCVYVPECAFGGRDEDDLEQCQAIEHKATCFSTGGLSME